MRTLDHYGAVSGLNAYEDFDTVILAQPSNPSPIRVAEYYRSVYGGRLGEPLNLDITWKDDIISDGKVAYQVCVTTMADDRLQPIYEHMRWKDMYQAAHRVRPIRNPRHIIIAFSIPIDGLQATEIKYQTIRRGPVGDFDRMVEAVRYLIRTQGRASRQDIASVAKVSIGTVKKHWARLVEATGCKVIKDRNRSRRYQGQGRPIEVLVPNTQR